MPRQNTLFIVTFLLYSVLTSCATLGEVEQREIEHGIYHLYVPDSYTSESDIVVVVHGTVDAVDAVELANTFINRWTDFADSTGAIIVSPAFDRDNFASNNASFGAGGYRGLFGREIDADEFLHNILAEVNLLAPVSERRFFLYGHSAGGQFANRYVVRHPERVQGVILSAPGRYAFPEEEVTWANGMGRLTRSISWPGDVEQNVDIEPDPEGWLQAAVLPISIVIGDEDTSPQPCRAAHCSEPLRISTDSTTRLAIAKKWQGDMNALAASEGQFGRVHMEIVEGIGHSSAALTPASREVLINMMEDRVVVPGVVGIHASRAIRVLESASLQGQIGQEMLSERPPGTVISQTPQAGSWADRNSRIILYTSIGVSPPPDRTSVPDVVGLQSEVARRAINAAGFTPRLVFVDSEVRFDIVIDQLPGAGEHLSPGAEVRIFISSGPDDIP